MKSLFIDALTSIVRVIGVNPIRIWFHIKGFPFYCVNFYEYCKGVGRDEKFQIKLRFLYPQYADRFLSAGNAEGHYFHQDIWAAKNIYERNPSEHIDIGSRIDGFISHLLIFRSVTVVDIRVLNSDVKGLSFEQGDITKLKYATGSIESLSCLHAIEHIGLGRYGDSIDHNGWRKALNEIQRVLKPGGYLYLSVPIGIERVYFDAHRVFDANTIIDALTGLDLVSFRYVSDAGKLVVFDRPLHELPVMKYGCGLFELMKPINMNLT